MDRLPDTRTLLNETKNFLNEDVGKDTSKRLNKIADDLRDPSPLYLDETLPNGWWVQVDFDINQATQFIDVTDGDKKYLLKKNYRGMEVERAMIKDLRKIAKKA